MKLKPWLDESRGRYTALAAHLGVSTGRVSQMAVDGVPDKFKLRVRDFTQGAVTLEEMVEARTPEPLTPRPVVIPQRRSADRTAKAVGAR